MVSIECRGRNLIVFIGILMCLTSAPLLCRAAPSPAPPAPGIASCSTWAPNSVQNVMVDGSARFSAAEGCGVELINVSVTFFALPQSTIVLDGWSMRGGGYVAIQGPPSAPWSIRDVAVIVTNSAIEASGGPTVSVMLGVSYSVTSTAGVVLRNVSLYCSDSRLWSSSSASNGQTSASVLSVILASALDAFAPNVTIDHFTVVAIDSDLRSKVTAAVNTTAAVASVASARWGRNGGGPPASLTVSNSVLYVLRCNATAAISPGITGVLPAEAAAVSAVAGVAFGKLSSVGLTVTSTAAAVVHSRVSSAVTTESSPSAFVASTVAGVAVALAQANSPLTVTNSTTFHVAGCNATSNSSSASTSNAYAFAASSVAGVAGVSVGYAFNSPITVANRTTFYLGWSNASSSCVSTSSTKAYAGSSVAGVAVGQAISSSVTIANSTTMYAEWSKVSSSSSSSNSGRTSADVTSYAGSSVAGVAVGEVYTFSSITVTSAFFFMAWSTAASSTSTNAFAAAFAGSGVAGVAVGQASTSPVTIANGTTFYVGWSNATIISTSTSNYTASAGSSVAGVAVGNTLADPVMIASSTMFYLGWSNATSTSAGSRTNTVLSSTSYATASSSVAGVASASTVAAASIVLLLALNFTSASTVSACATGLSRAAVSCMMTVSRASSGPLLCCTASSAPNKTFPLLQPPRIPLPTLPPPSPLTQGVRRHLSTTASTVVTRTSSLSPTGSAAATSSSFLAFPMISSAEAVTQRWPFLSSSAHTRTPTQAAVRLSPTTAMPPSLKPALQGSVQGVGLGLDPTVVTAVVAAGYGSSAVAAALSPTSGNKASAASRVVSGAECTLFGDQEQRVSSFPQPNDWSLMPGLSILSGLGNDGGSGASAAAERVLTTVVLAVVVWAANAAWLPCRGSMAAELART